VLLSDMVVAENESVPTGRLLQSRIEAEIAFVLGSDITSPDPTLDEVVAAVAQARPALEIVDSRVAGWDISIADTVADNASSGLFVLGEVAVALADLDPVAVTMTLAQDGFEVSSGNGAACLGTRSWPCSGSPVRRPSSAIRSGPARSCSAARSARWYLCRRAPCTRRNWSASEPCALPSRPPTPQQQHVTSDPVRRRSLHDRPHGKAIIILNPAEPPMIMRDTVLVLSDACDRDALVRSVE
jgi:hypothetical protein